MRLEKFTITLDQISLDAELALPDQETLKDNLVVIIAHGDDRKGMQVRVIKTLQHLLARRGFCAVRFNFPFAQKHQKRQGTDHLLGTYLKIVDWVRARGAKTVICGGHSLGSWVALLAAHKARGDGALVLGLPLTDHQHQPIDRTIPGEEPLLFISGTEDKYTDPKDLSFRVGALKEKGVPAEIYYVEDVDHSFTIPNDSIRTQREIFVAIVDMIDNWISHHWY